MRITIDLSEAEVTGIKNYLKDVDGTEKPTKADVQEFCRGELLGIFSAPSCAVSNYISVAAIDKLKKLISKK